MTSINPRTEIRRYIVAMLKDSLDIGGRVYANRPSPIFLQELPVCLVSFQTEPAKVIVGDRYSPKEYQRDLRVNIDIMVDQPVDPDTSLNESQKAEDYLDFLTWQAEQAMFGDWLLAERLPDYDPNNPCGLTLGMSLISTDPYNVDTDSDRRIIAQRSQFEVPYETSAYKDLRFSTFEEYNIKINRVGYDENTVDPTLIEAEGSF